MGLEERNGRVSVRLFINGRRRHIAVCDTAEEAVELEKAALEEVKGVRGVTLEEWGAEWLDRREIVEKVRSIRADRGRWRTHVEGTPLGRTPFR